MIIMIDPYFLKVSLYEMLLGQGLHVLAIDYRSFGDSSQIPLTEQVSSFWIYDDRFV